MLKHLILTGALGLASTAQAQQWDTIVGDSLTVGEPGPHWFTVKNNHTAFLVDGDAAEVKGTLTLSMFSPAIRPHLSKERIYSYGSYYTRTYYGERTDVVLVFDANTTAPVDEIEIPAKSAGIGHSGMIGLIKDRFVGVWNITPGMSVSLVDVDNGAFVGEIATPGCAAVYPLAEGFLMPCGDGTVQYIALDDDGAEVERLRSEVFFNVYEDPVFDYSVPTAEGWLFVTLEGQVFEATVSGGEVMVSEGWSINPPDDDSTDANGMPLNGDDDWRIGGRQPFAYNASAGLLMTLMHKGGGQETFEDAGSEIWAFDLQTRRRGYRLELGDAEARGIELTPDAEPLLLIAPSGGRDFRIHEARTGKELRVMKNMSGGLIQLLR